MLQRTTFAALVLAIFAISQVWADETPPTTGKFAFEPIDEARVPELFRLTPRAEIEYREKPLVTSSAAFTLSEITFPSPVVTSHEVNNTVHCEYFRPLGDAKRPGVIVLHILGGDFELSRLFCRALAARGCSALFLKMPYYGPRRPAGVNARMVSRDPKQTVEGMTQAIKDVRYGAAWLASRPEIDKDQIGIMGISLGGITGALAITAEPRISRACLLLAGGDIAKATWEAKELAEVRKRWEAAGGTKETFFTLMRTIDPVTYAANLGNRKVLMLNARQDEVIPPACSEALWAAFGKQSIVWWDAGHITSACYILEGLDTTTKFFRPAVSDGAGKE